MKNPNSNSPISKTLHIAQNVHDQMRSLIQDQLRGAAQRLLYDLFDEELTELCGKPFARKIGGLCHRAGSDPGSVLLSGQRVLVRKPRVKRDGQEVELNSYGALQDFDLLSNKVTKHMIAGVSTRNYEGLLDEISGSVGLKKTTVSRAFKNGSKELLESLNSRSLKNESFFCMMIDSTNIGDRAVMTVLGITTGGKKMVLGIRDGNTENWQVCRDLFHDLVDRGLNTEVPILFVIDGGKAIRKAIKKLYGDNCAIQRCTIHKLRNIEEYLPKQFHSELKRRWKRIHSMTTFEDSLKEHDSLLKFLESINHQAAESLREANLETLTAIKLRAPQLLRDTIMNTNPLESIFDKIKSNSRRVKNWQSSPDQIPRWAATFATEAEKHFRTIKGFKQIPLVTAELSNFNLQEKLQIA
jgi:putative transposase